jgi:hypothetical protein
MQRPPSSWGADLGPRHKNLHRFFTAAEAEEWATTCEWLGKEPRTWRVYPTHDMPTHIVENGHAIQLAPGKITARLDREGR